MNKKNCKKTKIVKYSLFRAGLEILCEISRREKIFDANSIFVICYSVFENIDTKKKNGLTTQKLNLSSQFPAI